MSFASVPSLTIRRRSDLLDSGDNRRLARSVTAGTWTKITWGVYTPRPAWSRLMPIEQHRVRVVEIMRRLREPALISHLSAASLWDIDVLGDWPEQLHVTVDSASGGRTSGSVRRYGWGRDAPASVSWGAHRVTTPAQTALDLARTLPFTRAVTAVDQALWRKRPGGPLTTKSEILAPMDAAPRRGDVRARRVIDFATDLSDSVRESQNRVVIFRLGFPRPRLQEHRVLRTGRNVYGDFYFTAYDHWAEVDGRVKYLRPEYTRGRSTEQVVLDERARENEIRREVRAFSRWDATLADTPALIYDILTGAGLPSSKPRP